MSLTRHQVVLWAEEKANVARACGTLELAEHYEFVVRALRDPEPDALAHGLAAKLREISEVLADAGVTGGTLRQGVIELRERAERAEARLTEPVVPQSFIEVLLTEERAPTIKPYEPLCAKCGFNEASHGAVLAHSFVPPRSATP